MAEDSSRRRMAVVLTLLLLIVGCGGEPEGMVTIKMATTTSTEDSGLLGLLLPGFEERCRIRVDVIATGTGAALRHAAGGDVDLVFVHSPQAERAFVEAGHGVDRTRVMYNDFVIVGPEPDPAGVVEAGSAAEALARIARAGAPFYSRDDDSGTYRKELALWEVAGLDPGATGEGWYRGTGRGMGATLSMTDEARGYTLADRGTFVAFREKVDLVVVSEGDPSLRNPYSVIAVNPARHRHVRYAEAARFIDWIVSEEGQGIIGRFRKSGELLFHPDAGGTD